jgi:hypothetical protein
MQYCSVTSASHTATWSHATSTLSLCPALFVTEIMLLGLFCVMYVRVRNLVEKILKIFIFIETKNEMLTGSNLGLPG